MQRVRPHSAGELSALTQLSKIYQNVSALPDGVLASIRRSRVAMSLWIEGE